MKGATVRHFTPIICPECQEWRFLRWYRMSQAECMNDTVPHRSHVVVVSQLHPNAQIIPCLYVEVDA